MTVLSFVEKLKIGNEDSIMLYQGRSQSGKDFIAFLKCDVRGVEKLRQDSDQNMPKDLHEYGEMIYLEYSSEPTDKSKQFLQNYLMMEDKIRKLDDAMQ